MIKSAVMIGGGTAGWMSATCAKAAFGGRAEVTPVESGRIPGIRVTKTASGTVRNFPGRIGPDGHEWVSEYTGSDGSGAGFRNGSGRGSHRGHRAGPVGARAGPLASRARPWQPAAADRRGAVTGGARNAVGHERVSTRLCGLLRTHPVRHRARPGRCAAPGSTARGGAASGSRCRRYGRPA
ncbi:tryptophan 7-halogenase [Streptacidiphilus sp. 4-A2]|nr:tryptophan 7-halogenase [Streptacidiphilus sp. 4-A2]